VQKEHEPHGEDVGPAWQFNALARMRAVEVFPTPRGPEKRYAWAIFPWSIAFFRTRIIGSWPMRSSNPWGLHFLAKTK